MLNIEPRGKQATALNMLRQSWKNEKSFLLYAPVGFGKTAIAAFITAGFVERKMRVMFVAPYTVLLGQTAMRFSDYGLPDHEMAFVWRDHPNYNPNALIQIASADTLIRREFPDNIDLLIVDECHLRRQALLKIIDYLRDNTQTKVIGLSGSPFSKWLGNFYDRLIKPTTLKEQIQTGQASPYEFYAPSHPDLSGVKTKSDGTYGTDYNDKQSAEVMSDSQLVADIVQNWLENGENRPTICFCVNVNHANYVTTEFNRAGVQAEIMTASTPHGDRDLTIRRFEQGITKIIVNVGVLVAGFDSDVRCIIFARPTKSEIRWIQIIGRGLRTAPGKKNCLIFDHTGTVNQLGYPDDIEYDQLKTSSHGSEKATRQLSRTEQPERLPKECPQCHFMKPQGIYVCPKCGFKPLAGEDVETDRSRKLSKVDKNKQSFTQEMKQSWWSQLLQYQRSRAVQGRPLSVSWCSHVFRKKFGVWPDRLHYTPKELTPEVQNFIKSQQIAFAKSKKSGKSA